MPSRDLFLPVQNATAVYTAFSIGTYSISSAETRDPKASKSQSLALTGWAGLGIYSLSIRVQHARMKAVGPGHGRSRGGGEGVMEEETFDLGLKAGVGDV